jgi:hypothetical protein
MAKRSWTQLLLLLAGSVVVGCSEPVFCTDNLVPAIELEVRDRTTAELVEVPVLGLVREGGYQDSLIPWVAGAVPLTYAAALERKGTYTVELEAAGYEAWDTAGVQVFRNECHVITEHLSVALQTAP